MPMVAYRLSVRFWVSRGGAWGLGETLETFLIVGPRHSKFRRPEHKHSRLALERLMQNNEHLKAGLLAFLWRLAKMELDRESVINIRIDWTVRTKPAMLSESMLARTSIVCMSSHALHVDVS
jgi:hypothetical protein